MRFPSRRLRRFARLGISQASVPILALVLLAGCSRYKPYAAADAEPFLPDPTQAPPGGPESVVVGDVNPAGTGSQSPAPILPVETAPALNPAVLGEAAKLAVGREFEPVYFEQDSYELTFSTRRTIHEYAQWLSKNPHVWVTLEGHNDDSGTVEYSLNLAMARAWAVRDRLAGLGVDDARLFTISFGEAYPVVPDSPSEPAPLNRRVGFLAFVAPEGGLPNTAPSLAGEAPPAANPLESPASIELP